MLLSYIYQKYAKKVRTLFEWQNLLIVSFFINQVFRLELVLDLGD